MAKLTKNNAMLVDIQYVKPNHRAGKKDYLYIIWKDLDTMEKHLQIIEEPMMDIYFEKPEYRTHLYNKNYARLKEVEKHSCKYKDIIHEIAKEQGPQGLNRLQDCYNTGNYKALREFHLYPYVFGSDFDIRAWYRYKWMQFYDNMRPKKISKGFLDIEVDIMESIGSPSPIDNPIDLVTIIDGEKKHSYTFGLIGVDYPKKGMDLSKLPENERFEEEKKKILYKERLEQQKYWSTHIDELTAEAHNLFDESYPGFSFDFYFYTDEGMMLCHLFQLINRLKLDFIEIWNMAFDIPFIHDRLDALGFNPADVMCHPDFPSKECWFKKDHINFQIKNKSDSFTCSSYTIFTDQMRNYAAIRKGSKELRSNQLTYVASKEIKDEKLDYSESSTIKTLSYIDYLKYILYNIKDVLLQYGIENKTSDLETFYLTSYRNYTPYESEFKQTVKLRNIQYASFMAQGLVPGANVNAFLSNFKEEREADDKDDEDETENEKKEDKFEGALVGNPLLINAFGMELFGKKSNNIFRYTIDFDMSKFYPSCIAAMNIDPSCLIFKMIVPSIQYDVRGGKIPYHGITDVQLVKANDDSFDGDVAKEVMDNFQTRNYLSFGEKWMNLPSVNEVYDELLEELGE